MTDDDGDLDVFQSVSDARRYMEAVDVLDGVYEVFDSQGYLLRAAVRDGLVELVIDPDAVPQPDELSRRIRSFIARVGPDRIGVHISDGASLGELMTALTKLFGL